MPRYASIVPSIRTVHGVDVFDYRVDETADLAPGDIIRIPFRKKQIIGMVVGLDTTSPAADKAVDIGLPQPLIRAGRIAAELLAAAAARCFCPRPTVLASWLRSVPKRAIPVALDAHAGQSGLPIRQTRFAIDRIAETERIAAESTGPLLVLVPWQHRAMQVAAALEAPYLHADLAAGAAWKAIQAFASKRERIIVTTRIGAWLSIFAETVVIDEPENDDFKQDEMTPRLDARWIADETAKLRPNLSIIRVSTTPSVAQQDVDWSQVPNIEPELVAETTPGGRRGPIDGLTLSTLTRIEGDIEDGRSVLILHPVRGERARFACRDCGWIAPCANCGFVLSRLASGAVCRKCGKRAKAPSECANCGGVDLSRSKSGSDRLAAQVAEQLGPSVRVIGLQDFWHINLPATATLVVTDIALIGGAVEDIRRKERLAIAWRRLCAMCQAASTSIIAQGDERLLAQARSWLETEALREAWARETSERALFGYPPAKRMAKLLIDGPSLHAEEVYARIQERLPEGWQATPPLPVPYRPASSLPRSCLQVSAPQGVSEATFAEFLRPLAGTAIIDLDPIAFFS